MLEDERVRAALRARGVEDLDLVQVDVLPSGGFGHPLERGPPLRPRRDVPAPRPGRQRLRPADRAPHRLRRSRRPPRARGRGGERRPIPRGRRRLSRRGRARRARTCARSAHPARRRVVQRRRRRGPLAPLDARARDRPPGGPRPPRRPLRRPAGPLPRLVRGDDRAVRRARPDAQLAHVLRRRRVRPRRVPELARARLRLPGRDHAISTPTWPTTPATPGGSPTRSACTRRTRACSGSTATTRPGDVEMRRGRRFVVNVDGDGRQLRVRVPLVPGPRRRRSSSRSSCTGIVSTIALGPGEPAGGIERRRPRPRRAAPPALVLLPARPRRRRRRQPGQRGRVRARPDRAGQPARQRLPPARDAAGTRGRGPPRRRRGAPAACGASSSPDRTNAHGRPTGYRLVPGHGTATLLAQPGSSVDRRAPASPATRCGSPPYDAEERFPAGAYPYQHADPGGLPAFSRDRPLDGEDVVLWYTVGVTHFVRPEDWPIMPMTRPGSAAAGRLLRPQPDARRPPRHACHGGRPVA